MPSRLDAYRGLIATVLDAGYRIISIETFWDLVTAGRVDAAGRYFLLRHDIDTDPSTARAMWQIDQSFGVASSYFFRLSTLDPDLMRAIHDAGGHASYHYEELATIARSTRVRTYAEAIALLPSARAEFLRNLEHLRRRTGLSLRVVASHGDFINRRLGLANTALLADVDLRLSAGIDLDVYDEALIRLLSSRHSDTHYPRYWIPDSPLDPIASKAPVVQVLVHPRHWHARRIVNVREDIARLWAGLAYALPSRPAASSPHLSVAASSADLGFPGPVSPAEPTSPGPSASPARTSPSDPSARPEVDPNMVVPSPTRDGVLLVRAPGGYVPERTYVVDVVMSDWLGVPYVLEIGEGTCWTLRARADPSGRELTLPDVLFATPPGQWLTETSMPVHPLARAWVDIRHLPGARGDVGEPKRLRPSSLPILFGEQLPGGPPWRNVPGGLELTIDVFGSVFFLLSRYEEIVRQERDRFDRFPARASVSAIEGCLARPIADEYAELLWEAMLALWPRLVRRHPDFRLQLTHDVDAVSAVHGRPGRAVARSIVGDVVRHRDPDLAFRRLRYVVNHRIGRAGHDPFDTFDQLMDTSERRGFRATFYVVAGRTSPVDADYRLGDPEIARLLRRIHDRGHEIGLHGSYDSHRSSTTLRFEIDALRAACRDAGVDQPVLGVRQHFLRFRNPDTWQAQEAAGLAYDSTLGYAEAIGFRAGTCREFPVFDLGARQRLALRERPLLLMDRTLDDYLSLGRDAAIDQTLSIVRTCRQLGGTAILLFHNSGTMARDGRAYDELVAALAGSCSPNAEGPVGP
jgi:peptidoglycan/xylan/chitin deacetylase (PgdA/CDA1 family)